MILQRLAKLREQMKTRGLHAYIIPTADFHESEYVGEYFKCRKYMSGFTGSAGTLVVTETQAALWTDGRYFIQAAAELAGSGIALMKMGQPQTPSIEGYLAEQIPQGGRLGFDGRVITAANGKRYAEALKEKNISLFTGEDLVDAVWEDRPALSCEPAFLLEEKYSGKSTAQKLQELREQMKTLGANTHIITTLDDIAWLLNIRGNDVAYNPVVLSYAVITLEQAHLFANAACFSQEVKTALQKDGVVFHPYDEIVSFVKQLDPAKKVLLDPLKVNYEIYIGTAGEKIEQSNPTQLKKAMKNETELANIRNAHIKDGVAFTKFMYWLKTNVGKIPMSEISAEEYLLARRQEQAGFIEPSFETISAYGPNAAMMHYSATAQSNAEVLAKGMLLVDSGGQYFEGTTDITRTMVLGPVSDRFKEHFTAVLRATLNLSGAKFLHGCNGQNLDILARAPIWELDLDYRSGTGHGIGYLLNVHEAPNGFRWKTVSERSDSGVFEEGMVTSDEPGIYLEGEYGIRTENELICRKGEQNEYGQFMFFEIVTYAPIDLDGVLPQLMSVRERAVLNEYHQMVYEKLSPYFDGEEKAWLREYTRPI